MSVYKVWEKTDVFRCRIVSTPLDDTSSHEDQNLMELIRTIRIVKTIFELP